MGNGELSGKPDEMLEATCDGLAFHLEGVEILLVTLYTFKTRVFGLYAESRTSLSPHEKNKFCTLAMEKRYSLLSHISRNVGQIVELDSMPHLYSSFLHTKLYIYIEEFN